MSKPLGIRLVLEKVEKPLSSTGLICACSALFITMVIVVIGVIGRFIFNLGIIFVDEYTGYGLVVMSFMGLANTLTAGRHIQVDSFTRLLPKRVRDWFEVVTSILALGISVLVTVQAWKRAMLSYHTGEFAVSPLETPLFIPQFFIPIGFILLNISFIIYIWDKIENVAISRPQQKAE